MKTRGNTLSIIACLMLLLKLTLVSHASYAFDHNHSKLDSVLKEFVIMKNERKSSEVNYAALSKDSENSSSGKKRLEAYLALLSAVSKKEFDTFNRDQQLSFLINAYNAFTLKTIIDFYRPEEGKVLKGIKDVCDYASDCPTFAIGRVWKRKFFTLLGEKQHLDGIEHGIIRKNYDEPRIHFAVNCASIGCPALLNEAFTAEKLETQLEAATSAFLSDSTRNSYDPQSNTLKISKIFDWFEEDFEKKGSSVQSFVAKYMGNPTDAKIRHKEYDWALNDLR